MRFRYIALAAIMAMCSAAARADGFSDTWMGLRDGMFVANPGGEEGSRDVNKVIFNAGHFDVWDYGTNFLNLDVLFSNPNEPALNSSGGSTEFYGVYRGQFSPDKIFGINTKFGPITAINFEIGGDAETENSAFAPEKRLFVAGPNIHFDLGKGFLNVGLHISKEWNHNGFCADACSKPGGPVSFDPAPEAEFVWLYSLKDLTNLPLTFSGFMNIIGPKGKDGFGNQTYTEILAMPKLSLDFGSIMFHKPHKPDLFLAVELWEHKFGNSDKVSGSEEVTPEIGFEVHF